MDKKMKTAALFLMLYIVIFWVGFRSGEVYNRMKKGYTPERLAMPVSDVYYAVEERDYGTYRYTDFRECRSDDPLIQFLYNEKLKPLLEHKKVQIYKSNGDKVY